MKIVFNPSLVIFQAQFKIHPMMTNPQIIKLIHCFLFNFLLHAQNFIPYARNFSPHALHLTLLYAAMNFLKIIMLNSPFMKSLKDQMSHFLKQ